MLKRLAGLLVAVLVLAACDSGSSSAPGASGATGGSGSPADADAALAAYLDLVQRDDLTFHLRQDGTVSIPGSADQTVTYDLDVRGADARATAAVGNQTVEFVILGDRMWVRSGGVWNEAPADPSVVGDITDVFRYVGDPDTLELVDTREAGGRTVFRFSATEPREYQTKAMKDQGVTGQIVELDVEILGDGVPVSIAFSSETPMQGGSVKADSTIAFSNWGEPIEIEAPEEG